MRNLEDILLQCPSSDERQRQILQEKYGLASPGDLRGAVVFGAASLGARLARRLEGMGIPIAGFSDNAPGRWNGRHEGWPVLSPNELEPDRVVVIASKYVKDISAGLRERGATRQIPHYILPLLFPADFPPRYHCLSAGAIRSGQKSIRDAFSLLGDQASKDVFLGLLRFRLTLDPEDLPDPTPDQYFPGDVWTLSGEEVFVDVGACDGDTLFDFLRRTGGAFSKYFAFEPDLRNIAALKGRLPDGFDGRLVLLPCGAGDRRRGVAFIGGDGGESRVADDGVQRIEVVPLDEVLAGEGVTTIKIDVEGYEREVLGGAQSLIAGRSPKLAVSVYHKLEDLWEIPLCVKACNAGYGFRLRHHAPEIYDSVLYCLPDRQGDARHG